MTQPNAVSIQHAPERPNGTVEARKVNRNALKASLHEMGFLGVKLQSHNRDYVLVSLAEVPEPRKDVAEVYFENWDAAYEEPDAGGYEWGVRI
jgi:hypothetical protein